MKCEISVPNFSSYGDVRAVAGLAHDAEAAGATWWLESLTDWRGTVDEMRGYVRGGRPRE